MFETILNILFNISVVIMVLSGVLIFLGFFLNVSLIEDEVDKIRIPKELKLIGGIGLFLPYLNIILFCFLLYITVRAIMIQMKNEKRI